MADTTAEAGVAVADVGGHLADINGRNGAPDCNGFADDSDLAGWHTSGDPDEPDRWQNHAACRGMPASMFYPDKGESAKPALAVCRTCPVAVECLEHANANSERHGIWGGVTERGRRPMRNARRRTGAYAVPHDRVR